MPRRFSMPAEWEPHKRTWMCWPCREGLWPDMAAARRAYAEVARAIMGFEPVIMAARPEDAEAARQAGLEVWSVPLDDSWARDIGPTFLRDGAIQWRFNAWGEKYAPFDQDAGFATRLAEREGLALRTPTLVCEGGALHSDGKGTLLTTEQCLLNPNRNPKLDKGAATEILCNATGAERVLWLAGEFSDRETDGHIDNIACFLPGSPRVLVGVPGSIAHPDYRPARDAIAYLQREGLETVELVQPDILRWDRHGRLLQTSYINFVLCNGGLVMPSFDDPGDEAARAVLADCFPDRAIKMVPALDIVVGGGGLHCITLGQPA
jgi:agmatine deiminase